MLGLVFVIAWAAFVGAYLIWQQLSGDLGREPSAEQTRPPVVARPCAQRARLAPVAVRSRAGRTVRNR